MEENVILLHNRNTTQTLVFSPQKQHNVIVFIVASKTEHGTYNNSRYYKTDNTHNRIATGNLNTDKVFSSF